MVNNDIITALKNSIEHGDSLQNAINVLINSGYNSQEVYEASKFVGGGALNLQQIKPTEQFTMPSKGFLPRSPVIPQAIPIQKAIPNSSQTFYQSQTSQQVQKNIQNNSNPFYQPQTVEQNKNSQIPVQYQQQAPIQNSKQEIQQIKQEISSQNTMPPISPPSIYSAPAFSSQPKSTGSLSNQLNHIAPPKQTYFKEIILIIILLMLIAILIGTLLFKDLILKYLASIFG